MVVIKPPTIGLPDAAAQEQENSVRFHGNEIRYHPAVLTELERWWHSADADASIEFVKVHGADALDFHQYAVFYSRLVFAFNSDENIDTTLDIHDAEEALHVDWENDSAGNGDIDKVRC